MKKILFFIILTAVLTGITLLAACYNIKNTEILVKNNKITVIVTIFPVYDFVKAVGQDKINVILLVPPGVEPHSFEPKSSDIANINNTNLFIYAGKYMEPWAEGVISGTTNNKLDVIDISAKIKMIPAVFQDSNEPSPVDPHIWLDFNNDKIIIDEISDALVKKDPANSQYYLQNAADYKNKLQQLDSDFRNGLSNCVHKEIIYGGHYAFGYLAAKYGLKYLAAEGISPDAEPTANDLAKLIEQIKTQNIKYIFYEELTSPKIAETLAAETGAKLLLLNAAHNVSRDQVNSGTTFIDIMQNNLINLKMGLQCQ
jgi:zinc transport system substrate-binding protein